MEDIVLNEEDVPGAHFTKDPKKYSVVNFKRWLECHGLKQTGKKQCLTVGGGVFNKYEITPDWEGSGNVISHFSVFRKLEI